MKRKLHSFGMLLLKLLKDSSILLLLSIICIGSIAGVIIPKSFPTLSSYTFQVKTFDTSISIYQQGRSGPYFSLSPFNDFLLMGEIQQRIPFLDISRFNNKQFTFGNPQSKSQLIFQSFRSFDSLNSIQASFQGNDTLHYKVIKDSRRNWLRVERTLPNASKYKGQQFGSTFEFDSETVVIDPVSSFVYTNQDESVLATYVQALGFPLTPLSTVLEPNTQTTNRRWLIANKRVLLFHPKISGAISISANPDQQLIIDSSTGLVELIETIDDEEPFIATMSMQLYKDIPKNKF